MISLGPMGQHDLRPSNSRDEEVEPHHHESTAHDPEHERGPYGALDHCAVPLWTIEPLDRHEELRTQRHKSTRTLKRDPPSEDAATRGTPDPTPRRARRAPPPSRVLLRNRTLDPPIRLLEMEMVDQVVAL